MTVKGIAFFDLDGTITSKDTFLDFIKYCRGDFFFYLGLFVLSPYIFLYIFKLYPNYKLKELFFTYYLASYYSILELDNLGKLYSIERIPDLVYKEALIRIKWHKEIHHEVIILTASSPIWLSEWCKINKLLLIGTEFIKKDDKYTGEISGKNCFGLQKQIIVDKILRETDISITYGYGDSKADKFFLDKLNIIYFPPYWV